MAPETLTFRGLRDRTDGEPWDSRYVETFWLPLLGPGPWALLRFLHAQVEASDGVELVLFTDAIAARLGMAAGRTVHGMRRLYLKRLIRTYENGFEVPTMVRRLTRTDADQLPAFLEEIHRRDYLS